MIWSIKCRTYYTFSIAWLTIGWMLVGWNGMVEIEVVFRAICALSLGPESERSARNFNVIMTNSWRCWCVSVRCGIAGVSEFVDEKCVRWSMHLNYVLRWITRVWVTHLSRISFRKEERKKLRMATKISFNPSRVIYFDRIKMSYKFCWKSAFTRRSQTKWFGFFCWSVIDLVRPAGAAGDEEL